MKFEKMTDEQALEILRSQKDQPDTPGSLIYRLLGGAMPGFKGAMEKYAASMLATGYNAGRVMSEAEKDPEQKEELHRQMHSLAQKLNAGSSPSSSTDEEEKK